LHFITAFTRIVLPPNCQDEREGRYVDGQFGWPDGRAEDEALSGAPGEDAEALDR
jgi:hypothetical protein